MRHANMRYTTHNTQLLLKTQDPRFSRILPGSSWVLTKSPVWVLWSSSFRRGRWVLNPAVPLQSVVVCCPSSKLGGDQK